jgi:hypothetical protein
LTSIAVEDCSYLKQVEKSLFSPASEAIGNALDLAGIRAVPW